jgi:hypothetical protein
MFEETWSLRVRHMATSRSPGIPATSCRHDAAAEDSTQPQQKHAQHVLRLARRPKKNATQRSRMARHDAAAGNFTQPQQSHAQLVLRVSRSPEKRPEKNATQRSSRMARHDAAAEDFTQPQQSHAQFVLRVPRRSERSANVRRSRMVRKNA